MSLLSGNSSTIPEIRISSFELSLLSPYAVLHNFRDSFFAESIYINKIVGTGFRLPPPLHSTHGNALNPSFLNLIGKSISVIFAILIVFQTIQYLKSRSFRSRESVGTSWSQILRVLAITIQIVSLFALYFIVGNDYITYDTAATVLAALLHVVEYQKSTVAAASLLFYWLVKILFLAIVVIQDSVSKHHILSTDSLSYGLEIAIFATSVLVLILEVGFYTPGFKVENHDSKASVFSSLSFSFIQPVIDKVYQTDDIKISELPEVADNLRCDEVTPKLRHYWNYEKSLKSHFLSKIWSSIRRQKYENTPVLFGAVFKAYYGYLLGNLLLAFTETILQFSQPFVLMKFLGFFDTYLYTAEEDKPPIIIGYYWAGVMFLVSVGNFITYNQMSILQNKLAISIRSSLTSLVYQKALNFSPASRSKKPTGDIINNISVDVGQINGLFLMLGDYSAAPIKLIVCLVALYKFFKTASFFGLGAALLSVPLVTLVNATVITSYKQMMKDKDERTTLITEIINSAKSIKLYSWEKPMLERLSHVRNNKELQNLKSIGIIIALAQFLWTCVPFIISCACFAAFSWLYKIPLTPEIVFPALSLFDLLMEPMMIIPNLVVSVVETKVSLGRLTELLTLEEISPDQDGKIKRELLPKGEYSVKIQNTNFVWNLNETDQSYKDEEDEVEGESSTNVALKDINFLAKKGKLTCVVGKVGSGKSTLLNAILGDIPIRGGDFSDNEGASQSNVEAYGSIAYCPQSPWILNGTVKENILFGHKYDSEFYRKTIIACELVSDFKTLPDGDKTNVGEKGISLSGGQKARISLARAVYARADIYLLDDVLAAVDAHVGKALIKQVLASDGIIGNRTKILATNSVPVLHDADDIYLLSKGSVIEHGKYEDVMARKGDLASLINEFGRQGSDDTREVTPESEQQGNDLKELEDAEIKHNVRETIEDELVHNDLRRASIVSFDHVYADDEVEGEDNDIPGNSSGRKTDIEEEGKQKGTVPLKTFLRYVKESNVGYFSVFLISSVGVMLLNVVETYILKDWSNINKEHDSTVRPVFFLGLYFAVGALGGALTYFRYFIFWSFCIIRAAGYFHDTMAKSILRSPMSFFDTTPVGRVLNRFTQDVSNLDMTLPFTLISFLQLILKAIITLTVVVASLPSMLVVILVLAVIYNYYRARYIPTSRELKRLQSVVNSPVLSVIQESLNGVETITAFHQKERFIHKCKKFIDQRTLVNIVNVDVMRWLSMRLQSISAVILLAASVLSVYSLTGSHPLVPAMVGFVLTYVITVPSILTSLINSWSSVQVSGVALERIIEYCDLPSEAPLIIEDKRPEDSWPAHGVVKFNNYSTRYRENLDPVLKDIEFTIESRQKVGVVGRTGAGKSSLTLALFRIIEATGGNIEIDGINISEIGLYDLRHHLTIIPQDAHTFKASVRENLDPFEEYTDERLWKVLELAHLKEHVEKMETDPTEEEKQKSKNPDELPKKRGLDAQIENGGSNLSAGQKQLLCLARALLNETSKILVLDEATAAVDFQTDKIIQETIREQFKDKTIITIAHRIDTIMDSDKILVLDQGKVAEFDAPQTLLKDENSIFYSLSRQGGYI
ncbi:hypothetical protein I9W82_005196 [Candida metapsilosis]|uniref:Uncharacterized protein n=1 Tax=Candida metapsilosis TaxID=273372 RepID=A0A8H8DA62_9ASCO|nr:hypothetical protein I9W82_005196 [Candida metapsilosis]